jgi:hypothetical protein
MSLEAAAHAGQSRKASAESFTSDPSLVLVTSIGLATFVLHLLTSGGYGYQRDELYFINNAQHLAWGYVDQPPLIALIAKFALFVFGDSLTGLRFLPALAAGATVVMSGRIARRLGGGLVAQGLAMVALALAPFYLAIGNLLTMNAFEPLLWTAAAYVFFKADEDDRIGRWLLLGLVLGLGFLNKYSMFFYAGSAAIAIALSPQRRVVKRPGLWLALAVAIALVTPNLIWQAAHGWPQFEVLRNAAAGKNVALGPLRFFGEQILMMNPLSALLWIGGLGFLLFSEDGRKMRWFGYTYLMLAAVYIGLQAKVYYLAPIYPILMAAGAVALERALKPRPVWTVVYATALVAFGLAIAPEAFPLLPLPAFLGYERLIDVRGIKMEKHPEGLVPQHFADMLGWRTLAQTMSRAYAGLPPAQQAKAVILTRDYGQAAALEFFAADYRLPAALSGHNNYFLYGTKGSSGDVVLALGLDPAFLRTEWRSVKRIATFHDDYLLPDQNDLPVYLCTGRIENFALWWPHTKRYI